MEEFAYKYPKDNKKPKGISPKRRHLKQSGPTRPHGPISGQISAPRGPVQPPAASLPPRAQRRDFPPPAAVAPKWARLLHQPSAQVRVSKQPNSSGPLRSHPPIRAELSACQWAPLLGQLHHSLPTNLRHVACSSPILL